MGNQLALMAWHPDSTAWIPSPDVMMHLHAGPTRRERMNAHTDGIPALIVEVASKTTWHIDVGLDPGARDGGKAYEYLKLGMPEYLVFDPGGEYIPQQCVGWRLQDGRREPWLPDAEGRYHSALGVSFPEGLLLRIYTPNDEPVLLDHEVTDLEECAALNAERVHQLEERLRRIEHQDGDAS